MSHTHHSKHMSRMYHINCTNHGNYTHHMNHTDQRHHARDKKNIRQINRVNYMHYMNLISIRQLCDITATVNTAFQRGPSKISKSLPPLMLIINRNSVFKIIVYRRTDVLDIQFSLFYFCLHVSWSCGQNVIPNIFRTKTKSLTLVLQYCRYISLSKDQLFFPQFLQRDIKHDTIFDCSQITDRFLFSVKKSFAKSDKLYM